ncbi:MAG: SUMF1/EgtB/PvdO family nonheme iron enzyme, partial [Isosphaeraceae bacterium]
MRLALIGLAAFLGVYGLTRWRAGEGRRSAGEAPEPEMTAPGAAASGMVWIPAGEFRMGSDAPDAWPEEGPAHRVYVHGFWMDEHEVTNREFGQFVEATGYATTAERPPDVAAILAQSP